MVSVWRFADWWVRPEGAVAVFVGDRDPVSSTLGAQRGARRRPSPSRESSVSPCSFLAASGRIVGYGCFPCRPCYGSGKWDMSCLRAAVDRLLTTFSEQRSCCCCALVPTCWNRTSSLCRLWDSPTRVIRPSHRQRPPDPCQAVDSLWQGLFIDNTAFWLCCMYG